MLSNNPKIICDFFGYDYNFWKNEIPKLTTKEEIKELIKMKDLPDYLIANYKKYFEKYEYISKKDYHLKSLID